MTYAWDSMFIGLMTGEIGTEMVSTDSATVRIYRLPDGYEYVKRASQVRYHIQAVGKSRKALCGRTINDPEPPAYPQVRQLQLTESVCIKCGRVLEDMVYTPFPQFSKDE